MSAAHALHVYAGRCSGCGAPFQRVVRGTLRTVTCCAACEHALYALRALAR